MSYLGSNIQFCLYVGIIEVVCSYKKNKKLFAFCWNISFTFPNANAMRRVPALLQHSAT